jgi:hypothetical protein
LPDSERTSAPRDADAMRFRPDDVFTEFRTAVNLPNCGRRTELRSTQ